MQQATDLNAIRSMGWLAETSAAFREAVLARSDELRIKAGEALYRIGDEPGGLYGVAEGLVEVHLTQHNDTPSLVTIVGPGFWTGEFATILGGPRQIAVLARIDCRVLRLSRAEFRRIADLVPDTWQMVSRLSVRNTIRTVGLVEALKCESPLIQVALTLRNLALESAETPPRIDLTQTELAGLARMSRGSVNGALKALVARGLIRQDYGAITVPDITSLAAFIDKA